MTDLTPADWELPTEVDPEIAKLRATIQNPILRDSYESRLKALKAEVAEVEAKLKALPGVLNLTGEVVTVKEVAEEVEKVEEKPKPAAKKPPARKAEADKE